MDKEIIRMATIADLDEITSLEAACFPETEAASGRRSSGDYLGTCGWI